jgi:predicted aldo/keto reductase-like oxidoreductase
MKPESADRWTRRSFLQQTALLGGGALAARSAVAEEKPALDGLPTRVLGKTREEVTTLALGTWPCGRCQAVDTPAVTRLVQEALELGVRFIDTAHNYGNAEEGIGQALRGRRDQVFLATKVWADTAAQARASLEESLTLLQTDHVDLLYLHSVGNRDVARALEPDGALSYLLEQKQQGKTRFVGISGHSKVATFVPVLETGKIDVVMMAMNFVDRHIYGFEDEVLPVAVRHDVGVVCMKVFGGLRGGFAVANGPNPGSQMPRPFLEQAVRYALGLPGVASLVIGPHTVEQLRQNVELVRNYRPLSPEEQASLAQAGQRMADEWGEHYGPVA